MPTISKQIESRIFLLTEWLLMSPLSIGSGLDDHSQHDIVRNTDLVPYIPATSIAGMVSKALGDTAIVTKIMGSAKNLQEGDRSRLIISDGAFVTTDETQKPTVQVRDGVGMEKRVAIANRKYDYEVIQQGAMFQVRMQMDILAGESEDEFLTPLIKAFRAINAGDHRLGFKTSRGMGRVLITGCIRAFHRNELRDSLDFQWDGNHDGRQPLRIDDGKLYEAKLQSLVVKMSIDGTLCIRQYAAELTEANLDYQHLTSNDQSVIPGSSWAGALRDCAGRVLRMLKLNEGQVEQTVRDLFGYVLDEKPKKTKKGIQDKRVAYPSNFVIDESTITGGHTVVLTRTKVDRFTGGAANGALFTEQIQVGGETELRIGIKSMDTKSWAVGLLLLCLEEIGNGFQPLGGEVGVGRGLLKVEEVNLNGTGTFKSLKEQYLPILAAHIQALMQQPQPVPVAEGGK